MSVSVRSKSIDGFRGIAVLLVVFSHAVTYRFASKPYIFSEQIQRLAGPLSEIGVQIFFVISGFIITSLLLREEASNTKINIAAFYVRRTLRILPPLIFYMIGLILARYMGWITFPIETLGNAMLFTCNTGLTDCQWWVAHTWSLAVEEQYYLVWPLLFATLNSKWRQGFLSISLVILMSFYAIYPHSWHSNFVSFACIIAGALFATRSDWQLTVKGAANLPVWIIVGMLLTVGPLISQLFRPLQFLMPLLIIYLIFAGREIPIVGAILRSKFLQFVGSISYSLYLWQQLFLAEPAQYNGSPIPMIGIVITVALSIVLIEKPSIRLGQVISKKLVNKHVSRPAEADHIASANV